MDLREDTCHFCSQKTRVISNEKSFVKIIKKVLGNEVLNYPEYSKIKSQLNTCLLCAHKLLLVEKIRLKIENATVNKHFNCFLCNEDQHLAQIQDWDHLMELLQSLQITAKKRKFKLCLECFYFLTTIDEVKNHLFKNFPILEVKLNTPPSTEITTEPRIETILTDPAESPTTKNTARRKVPTKAQLKIQLPVTPYENKVVLSLNHEIREKLKHFKPLNTLQNTMKESEPNDEKLFKKIPLTLLQRENFEKLGIEPKRQWNLIKSKNDSTQPNKVGKLTLRRFTSEPDICASIDLTDDMNNDKEKKEIVIDYVTLDSTNTNEEMHRKTRKRKHSEIESPSGHEEPVKKRKINILQNKIIVKSTKKLNTTPKKQVKNENLSPKSESDNTPKKTGPKKQVNNDNLSPGSENEKDVGQENRRKAKQRRYRASLLSTSNNITNKIDVENIEGEEKISFDKNKVIMNELTHKVDCLKHNIKYILSIKLQQLKFSEDGIPIEPRKKKRKSVTFNDNNLVQYFPVEDNNFNTCLISDDAGLTPKPPKKKIVYPKEKITPDVIINVDEDGSSNDTETDENVNDSENTAINDADKQQEDNIDNKIESEQMNGLLEDTNAKEVNGNSENEQNNVIDNEVENTLCVLNDNEPQMGDNSNEEETSNTSSSTENIETESNSTLTIEQELADITGDVLVNDCNVNDDCQTNVETNNDNDVGKELGNEDIDELQSKRHYSRTVINEIALKYINNTIFDDSVVSSSQSTDENSKETDSATIDLTTNSAPEEHDTNVDTPKIDGQNDQQVQPLQELIETESEDSTVDSGSQKELNIENKEVENGVNENKEVLNANI